MTEKLDADLLWVMRSVFTKGTETKPHSHDNYYHLIYIESNKSEWIINNKEYKLEEGMIILACPGVVHNVKRITSDSPLCFTEIKFIITDALLKRGLKKLDPVFRADAFVTDLIKEILDIVSIDLGLPGNNIRRYLLLSLAYHFISPFIKEKIKKGNLEITGIDTTDLMPVSLATLNYIHANYMREIRLETIAEALEYNKYYISMIFKKDTGINVSEYINFVRIKKAAELISFSDLDLTQIAMQTGFLNTSHFNRIFKKVVGIPPGQYRNSYKADILIKGEQPQGIEKAFEIPVWAGSKLKE